jgi:uncharacterized protein (DUF2342 family)
VSDAVDEHVAQALASLADVSARQLHATAEALERRRSGLRDFASMFRDVAHSREFGSAPKLADFHLRQSVEYGGDELAEQIAGAEAPFWRHVRDALRTLR